MTSVQKLALRMSQVRQRLNTIAGLSGDDFTDEIRSECGTLQTEFHDLETRHQAAIIADPEPTIAAVTDDAEARELREIEGRVRLGDFTSAALEMRGVNGAALEYNQALSLGADQFPLQLLARGIETRATTDTDTTTRPTRWLDRLFADTAGSALGLTYDSVAPGVPSYPVTTGGGTPAQRGRSQAAADSAWTIGATELKPTRLAVRYVFTAEDAARIPGLESALERDLRSAMTERMDYTIFAGDDTANPAEGDIAAITATAGIGARTLTQANKVKGAESLAEFVALLDGTHAESLADLNVVGFVGLNQLWRQTIINTAAAGGQPLTMARFLGDNGLNWRTRGGIEAATGNGKLGAMIGLSRGLAGAGVVAVWSGASLVRDIYSGAAKGEVALTLSVLWNFRVIRSANFAKLTFVT